MHSTLRPSVWDNIDSSIDSGTPRAALWMDSARQKAAVHREAGESAIVDMQIIEYLERVISAG